MIFCKKEIGGGHLLEEEDAVEENSTDLLLSTWTFILDSLMHIRVTYALGLLSLVIPPLVSGYLV